MQSFAALAAGMACRRCFGDSHGSARSCRKTAVGSIAVSAVLGRAKSGRGRIGASASEHGAGIFREPGCAVKLGEDAIVAGVRQSGVSGCRFRNLRTVTEIRPDLEPRRRLTPMTSPGANWNSRSQDGGAPQLLAFAPKHGPAESHRRRTAVDNAETAAAQHPSGVSRVAGRIANHGIALPVAPFSACRRRFPEPLARPACRCQ